MVRRRALPGNKENRMMKLPKTKLFTYNQRSNPSNLVPLPPLSPQCRLDDQNLPIMKEVLVQAGKNYDPRVKRDGAYAAVSTASPDILSVISPVLFSASKNAADDTLSDTEPFVDTSPYSQAQATQMQPSPPPSTVEATKCPTSKRKRTVLGSFEVENVPKKQKQDVKPLRRSPRNHQTCPAQKEASLPPSQAAQKGSKLLFSSVTVQHSRPSLKRPGHVSSEATSKKRLKNGIAGTLSVEARDANRDVQSQSSTEKRALKVPEEVGAANEIEAPPEPPANPSDSPAGVRHTHIQSRDSPTHDDTDDSSAAANNAGDSVPVLIPSDTSNHVYFCNHYTFSNLVEPGDMQDSLNGNEEVEIETVVALKRLVDSTELIYGCAPDYFSRVVNVDGDYENLTTDTEIRVRFMGTHGPKTANLSIKYFRISLKTMFRMLTAGDATFDKKPQVLTRTCSKIFDYAEKCGVCLNFCTSLARLKCGQIMCRNCYSRMVTKRCPYDRSHKTSENAILIKHQ